MRLARGEPNFSLPRPDLDSHRATHGQDLDFGLLQGTAKRADGHRAFAAMIKAGAGCLWPFPYPGPDKAGA